MISEIKKSMRRAELLGKLDDGEIPDNPYPPPYPPHPFGNPFVPWPENDPALLRALQAKVQRSQRKGR